MPLAAQTTASNFAPSDANPALNDLAHQLAKTHVLNFSGQPKTALLKSLPALELTLRKAYALFKSLPAQSAPVSRASEWMLDNFYIARQTFRQVESDLPENFLAELPKLADGEARILTLARAWVGACQSRLESTPTEAFIQAYQR